MASYLTRIYGGDFFRFYQKGGVGFAAGSYFTRIYGRMVEVLSIALSMELLY
jgi:hypothetical protein